MCRTICWTLKTGAFREFKDEDIHSKKRRFNKPKPDMIVIRYSAQQKHAHLMGIHTATRTSKTPEYKNTQWGDLIFTQN